MFTQDELTDYKVYYIEQGRVKTLVQKFQKNKEDKKISNTIITTVKNESHGSSTDNDVHQTKNQLDNNNLKPLKTSSDDENVSYDRKSVRASNVEFVLYNKANKSDSDDSKTNYADINASDTINSNKLKGKKVTVAGGICNYDVNDDINNDNITYHHEPEEETNTNLNITESIDDDTSYMYNVDGYDDNSEKVVEYNYNKDIGSTVCVCYSRHNLDYCVCNNIKACICDRPDCNNDCWSTMSYDLYNITEVVYPIKTHVKENFNINDTNMIGTNNDGTVNTNIDYNVNDYTKLEYNMKPHENTSYEERGYSNFDEKTQKLCESDELLENSPSENIHLQQYEMNNDIFNNLADKEIYGKNGESTSAMNSESNCIDETVDHALSDYINTVGNEYEQNHNNEVGLDNKHNNISETENIDKSKSVNMSINQQDTNIYLNDKLSDATAIANQTLDSNLNNNYKNINNKLLDTKNTNRLVYDNNSESMSNNLDSVNVDKNMYNNSSKLVKIYDEVIPDNKYSRIYNEDIDTKNANCGDNILIKLDDMSITVKDEASGNNNDANVNIDTDNIGIITLKEYFSILSANQYNSLINERARDILMSIHKYLKKYSYDLNDIDAVDELFYNAIKYKQLEESWKEDKDKEKITLDEIKIVIDKFTQTDETYYSFNNDEYSNSNYAGDYETNYESVYENETALNEADYDELDNNEYNLTVNSGEEIIYDKDKYSSTRNDINIDNDDNNNQKFDDNNYIDSNNNVNEQNDSNSKLFTEKETCNMPNVEQSHHQECITNDLNTYENALNNSIDNDKIIRNDVLNNNGNIEIENNNTDEKTGNISSHSNSTYEYSSDNNKNKNDKANLFIDLVDGSHQHINEAYVDNSYNIEEELESYRNLFRTQNKSKPLNNHAYSEMNLRNREKEKIKSNTFDVNTINNYEQNPNTNSSGNIYSSNHISNDDNIYNDNDKFSNDNKNHNSYCNEAININLNIKKEKNNTYNIYSDSANEHSDYYIGTEQDVTNKIKKQVNKVFSDELLNSDNYSSGQSHQNLIGNTSKVNENDDMYYGVNYSQSSSNSKQYENEKSFFKCHRSPNTNILVDDCNNSICLNSNNQTDKTQIDGKYKKEKNDAAVKVFTNYPTKYVFQLIKEDDDHTIDSSDNSSSSEDERKNINNSYNFTVSNKIVSNNDSFCNNNNKNNNNNINFNYNGHCEQSDCNMKNSSISSMSGNYDKVQNIANESPNNNYIFNHNNTNSAIDKYKNNNNAISSVILKEYNGTKQSRNSDGYNNYVDTFSNNGVSYAQAKIINVMVNMHEVDSASYSSEDNDSKYAITQQTAIVNQINGNNTIKSLEHNSPLSVETSYSSCNNDARNTLAIDNKHQTNNTIANNNNKINYNNNFNDSYNSSITVQKSLTDPNRSFNQPRNNDTISYKSTEYCQQVKNKIGDSINNASINFHQSIKSNKPQDTNIYKQSKSSKNLNIGDNIKRTNSFINTKSNSSVKTKSNISHEIHTSHKNGCSKHDNNFNKIGKKISGSNRKSTIAHNHNVDEKRSHTTNRDNHMYSQHYSSAFIIDCSKENGVTRLY